MTTQRIDIDEVRRQHKQRHEAALQTTRIVLITTVLWLLIGLTGLVLA